MSGMIGRGLASIVSVLALGYLALVALAFAAQRRLLFPAPPLVAAPTPRSQLVDRPETVLLVREAPTPEAPWVLHFHGNGEQLAWTEWMAERWAALGAGFVAVEYPGYGLAREKGAPSEASIVRAADAAARYLLEERRVPNERLIVSGLSLGSGPAVELASRGVGGRLVLFTPYTSLPDVAARALPFLPVRLLMRDVFDSAARAPRVMQPALVVHGTDDEVVPFALGEALGAALKGARLLRVEGGRHSDVAAREDVWRELGRFAAGP
ncbi:MAG: alpha/beta hydrolase [Myxococcaceae bacterium]|jgi:alpha-beta hydrolase superfamily lysophospholipase|nr:alpha/beta hydrolase [Myxococcaceae bacterium]